MNRPDLRFSAPEPVRGPVIDLRFSDTDSASVSSDQDTRSVLGVDAEADWDTVRAAHRTRLAAASGSSERYRINTAYASLRLMGVD